MNAFKEVLSLPVIVLIALLTVYGWTMTEDYNAEYASNELEIYEMRMTHLSEEVINQEFAKRAAEHFSSNPAHRSYTDGDIEKGCLFALKFGLGNDCVVVFKLDDEFEPINYQNLILEF